MPDRPSIDFRALAHEAVDLLCVAGTDGFFQWVNRRWEECLGWTAAQLLDRPFVELVHPDDVAATLAEVQHLAHGRLTVSFTNRYRARDGSYHWLEWNTRPMPDGRLYAVARDVTEKRAAVENLERQMLFLRLAEEMGQIGHWRFDLRTQALFWSPQVYRIHGLDPGTHTPSVSDGVDAYHPEDQPKVQRYVERCIGEREPYDFVLRLMHTSGGVRRVRAIGRPEVDPRTDEVVGMFGVFQDITESFELQSRLAHAEKMASVGTLAAGVAHEINNPLSYIKANAEVLSEQLLSGTTEVHEVLEMMEEIRDGTSRIQKIVSGLKTFSRTNDARPSRVALAQVLRTAERLCRNELKHRATFAMHLADDVPDVWADEAQLVQVAVNLIINAAHAIPEGRADEHRVEVRTGGDDADVFFEVEDTGVGMDDEILRRAFSPFFTTKPQGLGTGLGLSICHGIVTGLRGEIDVTSRPGEGTRVRVALPAMAADAAPEAIPPSSRRARTESGDGLVMVIDDDRQVGRALSRLLSRSYRVVFHEDPQRALQRLLDGCTPDAILCDVMMPNLSGPVLFDLLSRGRPGLTERVVFVTGGVFGPETRGRLEATGAPVIDKPVDAEELLLLLRDRIRSRAA